MRRRRRSSFRKEKAIMLVSSCLVLTALTATGLYVRNKSQDKEDGYVVDFTALEESNKQKAGEAQADGSIGDGQYADTGELDYDPSFQEGICWEAQQARLHWKMARQVKASPTQA